MKHLALVFLSALLAVPATAQPDTGPRLTLEHRMMLRCSAAFALVSYRQENGDAEALQYPPMKERGGEYFVRASARVMDEAGLDRDGVSAALRTEAQDLLKDRTLAAVMPVCLTALEQAGL